MNILHAAVLGLVQGLGEFLPISSSAHLIITPWLFKWPDPGLGYDVALHWGTLLAVGVYFWRDIILILKGFIHSLMPSTRDIKNNIYQKLAWLLVVASVPGAILGYLLESKAETIFRTPLLIVATMGGFGVLLWLADSWGKKSKNFNHFSFKNSFIIGCSQALAVIPGVSRSGSTIATGLALGFNREDAAKFSFLMSVPIIFGAGLVSLKNFGQGAGQTELAVGFVVAAITGFLAIKYMLRYLSTKTYKIFVWYRLVLAALILVVYFLRK